MTVVDLDNPAGGTAALLVEFTCQQCGQVSQRRQRNGVDPTICIPCTSVRVTVAMPVVCAHCSAVTTRVVDAGTVDELNYCSARCGKAAQRLRVRARKTATLPQCDGCLKHRRDARNRGGILVLCDLCCIILEASCFRKVRDRSKAESARRLAAQGWNVGCSYQCMACYGWHHTREVDDSYNPRVARIMANLRRLHEEFATQSPREMMRDQSVVTLYPSDPATSTSAR